MLILRRGVLDLKFSRFIFVIGNRKMLFGDERKEARGI